MIYKKIKVPFSGYHNLKIGVWVDWQASGKTALEYFVGEIKEADKSSKLFAKNWLEFLDYFPESMRIPETENIFNKTFAQKLDAISIIRANQNKIALALPFLLAIFRQKNYNRSQVKSLEKIIRETAWVDTYPEAMYYLTSLLNFEQKLKSNLIPLRETEEQEEAEKRLIQVSGESLKDWSDYSIIDKLAGGSILNRQKVLDLPNSEINAKLIYENRVALYLEKLKDIYAVQQEAAAQRLKYKK